MRINRGKFAKEVIMPGYTLSEFSERLSKCRMLVIGDVMLDRFFHGRVNRISPEAPIPIIQIDNEIKMLGGAGNVARNAVAFGVETKLIGLIGDDDSGKELIDLANNINGLDPTFITINNRKTTEKIRYSSGAHQLLRADIEDTSDLPNEIIEKLDNAIKAALTGISVVIISDYNKGTVNDHMLSQLISFASSKHIPVIIDPKGSNYIRYKGATILTPNAEELKSASGLPTKTDKEVEKAGKLVLKNINANTIVVTRGKDGISVIDSNSVTHLSVPPREVFDVSGAGDTVIAMLGAMLSTGSNIQEAAEMANVAAGVVVGKAGTAIALPEEIIDSYSAVKSISKNKISSIAEAEQTIINWKVSGDSIAFTNGCFDLIHPGHVSLLRKARSLADRLVLGLNSDDSVRKLKGNSRPIQNEESRAAVLSGFEDVDLVVLFIEDTPIKLIEKFKPDFLVKGADYTIDNVVGADLIHSYGGKVVLADLVDGQSSKNIVERIEKVDKG